MKNRETYVVYILDCWAVPGYSILKTGQPAIRDSNMLKLGEFVHYRTKFALELLGICLASANKHQMFQGGFDDYFSGYPENWLSASLRWGVENNENSQNTLGRRLSLSQTKGSVRNRLRFLKKHFMFLGELNRRIRENGINLRLSCIYPFQNISRLPEHCHKTLSRFLSGFLSFI